MLQDNREPIGVLLVKLLFLLLNARRLTRPVPTQLRGQQAAQHGCHKAHRGRVHAACLERPAHSVQQEACPSSLARAGSAVPC